MKYSEFKKKVESFPIISSSQLGFFDGNLQNLRNQLTRWNKQRLIIKLKRGVYVLNEHDRKIEPSKFFLANQMYSPSYISTECALGFYDLIPEKVVDVTSVTTKKTFKIKNVFGDFIYQHLNPKVFRGFTALKDENGYKFFIAMPEKAIVDFFYLNLYRFPRDDSEIFGESFRFQNLDNLKKAKLIEFSSCFNNDKLLNIIKNFCKYIKKQ
jgi:hypothetical protein